MSANRDQTCDTFSQRLAAYSAQTWRLRNPGRVGVGSGMDAGMLTSMRVYGADWSAAGDAVFTFPTPGLSIAALGVGDLFPAVSGNNGQYGMNSLTASLILTQQSTIPLGFSSIDQLKFTNKDGSVSLTNDNTAAQFNNPNLVSAYSTTNPIITGSRVIFTITTSSVNEFYIPTTAIGACVSDFDTSIGLGNDSFKSAGFYDAGTEIVNSVQTSSVVDTFYATVSSQVIDVAVDRVANRMWLRVNGGDWKG